jgi:hypothetical protein
MYVPEVPPHTVQREQHCEYISSIKRISETHGHRSKFGLEVANPKGKKLILRKMARHGISRMISQNSSQFVRRA